MRENYQFHTYTERPNKSGNFSQVAWDSITRSIHAEGLSISSMHSVQGIRGVWSATLSDGRVVERRNEELRTEVIDKDLQNAIFPMPFQNSKVEIQGEIAYVTLVNSDLKAFIDVADVNLVEGHRWLLRQVGKNQYAVCRINQKSAGMHALIMGTYGSWYVVDHIDGNGLNNRRSNMRSCSPKENSWNRRSIMMKKTAYKGVTASKNLFSAKIVANGVSYDLGYYRTEEEASAAYCGAAVVLHGSYANFVRTVKADADLEQ